MADPSLPAAPVLLGPGAHDLVSAALDAFGGRLAGLTHRQVLYTPGQSLTVRYQAQVTWNGGPPRSETIVAVTDVAGPPDGTLVMEAGPARVGLFRWPHDPVLPGLAAAVRPDRARHLLGWAGTPTVKARTYRPCRRAVIHARASEEAYLKVVPPPRAKALAGGLASLAGVVPVPRVVDLHEPEGVLVLEALPGRTLQDVLRSGDDAPDPVDVLACVRSIHALDPAAGDAPGSTGRCERPGLLARAADHARLLAAVLPSSRRRFERLVDRLGAEEPAAPAAEAVVHGDFHPAQLLVEGGRVSGILDTDDLRAGDPLDDLATFLGHLATLAAGSRTPGLRAYLGRTLVAFEDAAGGPAELHRRTAAAVLGLATGPHRVQQARWRQHTLNRLALAERWAAGDVRSLRTAS